LVKRIPYDPHILGAEAKNSTTDSGADWSWAGNRNSDL